MNFLDFLNFFASTRGIKQVFRLLKKFSQEAGKETVNSEKILFPVNLLPSLDTKYIL